MPINWKQVLEIETYLTNMFEQNFAGMEYIWRHPQTINSGLRVNKEKLYSFDDLLYYLTTKFPKDEMLKNSKEGILRLFVAAATGFKICEIDDELLDLNENQERYKLSNETLKNNILGNGAEYTGSTSFFLYCLKTITDSLKNTINDSKTKEIILSNFINYINQFGDFNSVYFSFNITEYNLDIKICDFITETYKKLEEKTYEFIKSPSFKSYKSSCEENNYLPPYSGNDFKIFHGDLMLFSINEVIEIIQKEDDNFFGFKLKNNISPYPEDVRSFHYGNLNVYITLNGLLNFDTISEYKTNGLLLQKVKEILSSEFTILPKESINDNFDPDVTINYNRTDSSLIIGKDLSQKKLYNQHVDDYHEKVMSGFVWYNNDANGINYKYLDFNDESDFHGQHKYSIPFENVIYKFFIAYLVLTRCEREYDDDFQRDGYWLSKNEFENETTNDNNDWDSDDEEFDPDFYSEQDEDSAPLDPNDIL